MSWTALDRLFGLTPGQTARSLDQFVAMVHPDDRAKVVAACERCAAEGADFEEEFRIVLADGSVRWLYDRGETFRDGEGRPAYMTGACVDITSSKQASDALAQQAQTLEILNQTGQAIAAELDLDRIVQRVTDAGVALTRAEFGAFFYNNVDPVSGERYTLYALSGAERSAFEGFPTPRNTAVFEPTFSGRGVVRSDDITADPRYGKNKPHKGMPKGHLPVRSYLAVPVVSRTGEVLGGLFFGHSNSGVFQQGAEDVMVGLASQAAVAIDNARLFQAAQREIADRAAAQEALKLRSEEFSALADNIPTLCWMAEPDGNIFWYNRRWYEYTGADPESQAGWGWQSVHDPEVLPQVLERWRASLATGDPFDMVFPLRGADGLFRPFLTRVVPIRDEQGRIVRWFGTNVDITEQRQAEARLEAQAATAQAERDRIWEVSRDMLAVAGHDGYFKALNPAWTRVLGYEQEALLARPFLDLVHPEDRPTAAQAVEQLEAGQPLQGFEDRLVAADGRDVWVSWTAVRDGDLIFAIGRDITAQKEAEAALHQTQEALRHSQKMEAIGQLTGGVAHDFNNMLTVIRSSVDLLQRRDISEERRRRYVDAIAETAERATRLTSQLLAFARRQPLQAQVFDVGDKLRHMVEVFRSVLGSRIDTTLDAGDGIALVEADPTQFETSLINMALNARDAMETGGQLHLSVRVTDELPSIRGEAARRGRFVAVSIADTGHGISPDQLEAIFEPFFTTKEVGRGTGLGLSQVYGFAKQSGGEVAVESEPGRGSTFTIYLPEAEAVEEPAALIPDADETSQAVARVLVVEDNQLVGDTTVQLLSDLGHTTSLARDAASALRLIEENPDSFALVFSDVVMPGEMNGVDLARTIRRLWPDLPVVLTTGYSDALAEERTPEFELIRKPYSVQAVGRLVRNVLRSRRRASGALEPDAAEPC